MIENGVANRRIFVGEVGIGESNLLGLFSNLLYSVQMLIILV